MTRISNRLTKLLGDFIDDDDDYVFTSTSQHIVWDEEDVNEEVLGSYDKAVASTGQSQQERIVFLTTHALTTFFFVVPIVWVLVHVVFKQHPTSRKTVRAPEPEKKQTTQNHPCVIPKKNPKENSDLSARTPQQKSPRTRGDGPQSREQAKYPPDSPVPRLLAEGAEAASQNPQDVVVITSTDGINPTRIFDTIEPDDQKETSTSDDVAEAVGVTQSNAIVEEVSPDTIVSMPADVDMEHVFETAREAERMAVDVQVSRQVFMRYGLDPNLASNWAMHRQISRESDESRADMEKLKMSIKANQREKDNFVSERRHQETLETMRHDCNWLEKLEKARNRCCNAAVYGLMCSMIISCIAEIIMVSSTLLQENGTVLNLMFNMVCNYPEDTSSLEVPFMWILGYFINTGDHGVSWPSFLPCTSTCLCVGRCLCYLWSSLFLHSLFHHFLLPSFCNHVVNLVAMLSIFTPAWNRHFDNLQLVEAFLQLLLLHITFLVIMVLGVWKFHSSNEHTLQLNGNSLSHTRVNKEFARYRTISWVILVGPSLVSTVYYREALGFTFHSVLHNAAN